MADEQVIEAATQDTPDVPSQSETQPEAIPKAGETTEPEIDWQAKVQELEKQVERAENNLRAERGRATKQAERDNSLFDLADRMGAMEQSNMALIRALNSGDTEALPERLTEIQNASTGRSAARSYQGRYNALAEELTNIVHDDDGNEIVSLFEAPELEEVRQLWLASHNKQDIAGLYDAMNQAQRVVRRIERTRSQDEVSAIRDQERAAAKRQLEEAGVYDMDTGAAASGAGVQDDDFLTSYARNPERHSTPEDHLRARRLLANL